MKLTEFYLIVATVSLALQVAVLALLILGFELKRRFRFRLHGLVMLLALAIHLSIILSIMVPSFVLALVPITLKNPTSLIGLISPVHTAVGSTAAVLAVWIVGTWRLRQSTEFCMSKKKVMRATLILWIVSLGLGVLLYLALDWNALF